MQTSSPKSTSLVRNYLKMGKKYHKEQWDKACFKQIENFEDNLWNGCH